MSAQSDRFVHDRLPPREQWPQLRYELPELQLPAQLNLAERLLDAAPSRSWGDRPCLRSAREVLTYAQVRGRVDAICKVLVEDLDLARGMIVKAFCVLKPGQVGDAAMVKALQDHVKSTIAPFKYPREIEFLPGLPRTETGKLQRFKLRQLQEPPPATAG